MEQNDKDTWRSTLEMAELPVQDATNATSGGFPVEIRGGESEERLYLHDLKVTEGGKVIRIRKTAMPDIESIVARHKARYHLPAFFCRPGMRLLDFPCGSGYAHEIFSDLGIYYEGYDIDSPTISYCNHLYQGDFYVGDLTEPALIPDNYDIIACIEGLEHIGKAHQKPLIMAFFYALKPNGILVVSSPEAIEESGPSDKNPHHKWELTYNDFTMLLSNVFDSVQILTHPEILHNGTKTNQLFGICRKVADHG